MNREVRLLFHELSDLSPAERERVFRERRTGPEVRAEVESLLEFDSTDVRHLTHCVSDAAGELLRSNGAANVGFCGPYRLVRLLGTGGMGAVYLGERTDGEIQQQVAIKLLGINGVRPVMRERFLKERQLLASLHHPSIVHVIDAGHTGQGRPYLVMEYVDGIPIDVYAAAIEMRDQLTLFLRVCEGVSHAHHHLVIHRDLKPSNILVESSGQPKLLDFGIAKLLDETADATQTVERLLTPNYASPEQLRGTAQTTATDVYSLGAVLYKLLTKQSPHESAIHTSYAMEVLAGTREIPAASRLNPKLPADIDHILRKALRNEPEERYASVEAFASDIRAFLEWRPVGARSGNAWYRTRKFLRRYRVPAAAAALAIAGLSAGLYLADRERRLAEERFLQLRQLSSKVFQFDQAIRNLPGSTQARRDLVAASLGYLGSLPFDPHRDLDLAREVGEGYWRVARVQGVPVELNLGEPAKAEVSLKKADQLIDTVLAARPKDRTALLRSATIAQDRMILAQEEGRSAEALVYAHKAAARADALCQVPGITGPELSDAAAIYGNIGLASGNLHRYAESALYARRTAEFAGRVPGAGYRVSQGLSLLANALRYQGDLDGALQAIQEARRVADAAVYANETLRMINTYGVLLREGLILGEEDGINLGRPDEAAAALQKAFDMVEASARKDPNDAVSRNRTGSSGTALGSILRDRDPQRALEVYDVSIRRLREVPPNLLARRNLAVALASSSYALRALHQAGEARHRIDAAMALLHETRDYPADQVHLDSPGYTVVCALADHQQETGDLRGALKTDEELLLRVIASKPEALTDLRDAPRLSRLYQALSQLYRRTGDSTQAEVMRARRLELWQNWQSKLPGNSFVQRQFETAVR